MMPFLIGRRNKQVLIKRIERPLKKGDIAFFQRENGHVYYAQNSLYAKR